MDSMSTNPAGASTLPAQNTFFTAARVAEAAGRAQAEGGKRRCSRQSRVIVTAD